MLMKMMLSEDIAADVITYNSLMSACVAASQWTLALCIFCELRDSLMRSQGRFEAVEDEKGRVGSIGALMF